MDISIDNIYCKHWLKGDLINWAFKAADFDDPHYCFKIQDTIHFEVLKNQTWVLYNKYIENTNQTEHSEQTFRTLLKNFNLQHMPPIHLKLDPEKQKYYVLDGVHRLAILYHLGHRVLTPKMYNLDGQYASIIAGKQFLDYDFGHQQRAQTQKLDTRYQNLQDVIKVLNKFKIPYWLQGKTLLGMFRNEKLIPNDSDEDIGVDSEHGLLICTKVVPELLDLGFKVIRITNNNSMITVLRDGRYLDICIFRYKGRRTNINQYGYEQKQFPIEFYQDGLIELNINNFNYSIPLRADDILNHAYGR